MAIRLKDIADATGFSINTVSRAINKSPDVSEKTRKIIESAAKNMGYVSNSAAKRLRTGKSNTFALILDNFINPHFSIIADEISLYASELGYNVIIYTSSGNTAKEERAIQSAIENCVDGIILCPTRDSSDNVRFMKNMKIPFILIARSFNWFDDCSYAVFDESRTGFIAAEHLILNGCRKIMSIVSEYSDVSDIASAPTIAGIFNAHQTYGLPFNPDAAFSVSLNIRSQAEEVRRIINKAPNYDGIICGNDVIALMADSILSSRNISVPIIGFGNIRKHLPFCSSITSIDCSKQSLSVCCVDSLMQLIEGGDIQQHTLPVRLIKTDSTNNGI